MTRKTRAIRAALGAWVGDRPRGCGVSQIRRAQFRIVTVGLLVVGAMSGCSTLERCFPTGSFGGQATESSPTCQQRAGQECDQGCQQRDTGWGADSTDETSAMGEPVVVRPSSPVNSASPAPEEMNTEGMQDGADMHADSPAAVAETTIGAGVLSHQTAPAERIADPQSASLGGDFRLGGDFKGAEADAGQDWEKTAETPHRRSSRFRPMWVR